MIRILSMRYLRQKSFIHARRILSVAVFLVAVILGAEGFCDTQPPREKALSVNYPPDKTVMELGLLSISLTVPQGSTDLIIVNVNGNEKARIIPDNKIECFTIPISAGYNEIDVTAIKSSKLVGKNIIDVYRRSDLEKTYKDPPPGFKKNYFHMKEHSQCTGCHILTPGKSDRKPVNIAAFPIEDMRIEEKILAKTSTCYSCHKNIASYPFVHGPVAVWSCLSCHDPVTEPKYSVKKPDAKSCYSCHVGQKEERLTKKYRHGPVNTGMCTICHNPHASEDPFFLVKSTWDLCIDCHIDKGSGKHIVKIFPGKNFHPTRGTLDPLRKNRELTCASCHDPHASKTLQLLRANLGTGFKLCKKCHTD